ncbi:MAG: prepilin-type N-terminal cleavage/methylation domain-containing protein [Candidatus Kaiserbacteria bacterium]|nr:prepilin-type N-terminal cleavage/methylation domain-containing protein [Candidatus Kaiserbacteria bacterium]MCB9816232.1 prepilin-type N-terminal cleavage/methylation domain-containing protein [Candidatus Nomurabacteria bacterium]
MKKSYLARKGFTLVEIMVVVAIISILSAILYANFGHARTEARNKEVFSELKELQLAIELYRAQHGHYPDIPACGTTAAATSTADSDTGGAGHCAINPFVDDLIPDFISSLPSPDDSANSACTYIYNVGSASQNWFKLTAENCLGGFDTAADGIQPDDTFARCPTSCGECDGNTHDAAYKASTDFYETVAVYSAGGQCE